MKQLLRAGISMLAVLAALLAFRAFMPSGDGEAPVSALDSSVEEVQPVSVTLPPYTPQSIPPPLLLCRLPLRRSRSLGTICQLVWNRTAISKSRPGTWLPSAVCRSAM